MNCRRVWSLLVVSVLFAWISGSQAADKVQIAKLIDQLGSDAYVEREEASKKLDEIGVPALDDLKKAVSSSDAEVQRRARDLVAKIDRRVQAVKVLAPAKVHLKFDNVPLADALREVANKSGIPLTYQGDASILASRRITLDTGEVTFWEAFDRFCAQAGLADKKSEGMSVEERAQWVANRRQKLAPQRARVQQEPEEEHTKKKEAAAHVYKPAKPIQPDLTPVVLFDRKGNVPVACYAGALRIRQDADRKEKDSGTPGEFAVPLLLSVEPRLRAVNVTGLSIEKATDDQGQQLSLLASDNNAGQPLGNFNAAFAANGNVVFAPAPVAPVAPTASSAIAQEPVSIHLKKGEKPTKCLKEVKGVVTVQVQTAPQEFVTVDKVLESTGKTVKGERGGSITLHEATKLAQGNYRLRLEMEAPPEMLDGADVAFAVPPLPVNANAQVQQAQAVARQVQLRALNMNQMAIMRGNDMSGLALLDAKGEKFQLRTTSSRVQMNNNQMTRQYILTYQAKADQGEPARLVLSGVRTTTVDVPFTLKDVKLP